MVRRALAAVLLALGVAASALAGDPPPKQELPYELQHSPVPFRKAVYKPSQGLYAGRAPAGPYWPHNALDLGVQGYAVVDCKVRESDLRLLDCRQIAERPQFYGLSEAVVRMADDGWMTAAPLAPGGQASPDGIYRFVVPFPRPRR